MHGTFGLGLGGSTFGFFFFFFFFFDGSSNLPNLPTFSQVLDSPS